MCILLFEKIQDVYWLLLTDEESRITINREQKSAIADGIIWGTLTLMYRTIERESPRKCAARDSKPFKQSKTALTENAISINILTDSQKLPARPRDLKERLADEEKNIKNPELSDALSSICRQLGLERSEDKISYPKGRPSSNSNLNYERRGRRSSYDKSRMMQIIDEVLSDEELFKKIDDTVTNSEIYSKYRPYSIEAGLLQLKQPQAFLNTYKPFIKKYGLREVDSKSAIETKDITNEVIKKTAIGSARDTKLAEDLKKGIYTLGGRIYFDYILRKHQQQATS